MPYGWPSCFLAPAPRQAAALERCEHLTESSFVPAVSDTVTRIIHLVPNPATQSHFTRYHSNVFETPSGEQNRNLKVT